MLTVVANKLCCYAGTLHAGERVIGGAEWWEFLLSHSRKVASGVIIRDVVVVVGDYSRKTRDNRAFKNFLSVVCLKVRDWPFGRLRLLKNGHRNQNMLLIRVIPPLLTPPPPPTLPNW